MSSKNKCYVPLPPCAFPPIPEPSVLQSAFRAFNATTTQNVGHADLTQIVYPNKVFDLNNEYDPITSTFTPKQNWTYNDESNSLYSEKR